MSTQHPGVPLFQLENVAVERGGQPILVDVCFELFAGKHWAVLGPNGSGKTTLLKVMCGDIWPTAGVVRRRGEELVDLRELRQSIGRVSPEIAAAIPALEPVVETVVSGKFAQLGLHAYTGREPAAEDFEKAHLILSQLGCDGLAEKRFGTLSQGERQQVLVARSRMASPLVIILDEPCVGMDPGVRERFLAWLTSIAAMPNGPALMLVTHHVEEIVPGFESTLVLKEGRVLGQGPTHEMLTPELLSSLYAARVVRLEKSGGRLWPTWGL